MRGSEDVELEPTDSEREEGFPLVDMELKNISNLVREWGSDTIKGLHTNGFGELIMYCITTVSIYNTKPVYT